MSGRRWIEERQKQFPRTNDASSRLRGDLSATERRFWQLIRKIEHPGGRFRRQAAVGSYVLDFVHHGGKLVVELDGHFHDNPEARAKDAARDTWLTNEGFRVLRFRNEQIWDDTDNVLDVIRAELAARAPSPQPLSQRGRGATLEDSSIA